VAESVNTLVHKITAELQVTWKLVQQHVCLL